MEKFETLIAEAMSDSGDWQNAVARLREYSDPRLPVVLLDLARLRAAQTAWARIESARSGRNEPEEGWISKDDFYEDEITPIINRLTTEPGLLTKAWGESDFTRPECWPEPRDCEEYTSHLRAIFPEAFPKEQV